VNRPLDIPRSARRRARTEERRALIYVVSVALVAAATTVSFGIASFSFLDITRKMPRGSDIHEPRAELKPVLSDVVPYAHDKTAPVPAEAKVLSTAVEPTLRASAPERPASISNGTTPSPSIAAEQRDQVFREFEMYNSQKVRMDGDNAASKGTDRSPEKRSSQTTPPP
jgi:hypothetical protein